MNNKLFLAAYILAYCSTVVLVKNGIVCQTIDISVNIQLKRIPTENIAS
jgi:hypothetical protein